MRPKFRDNMPRVNSKYLQVKCLASGQPVCFRIFGQATSNSEWLWALALELKPDTVGAWSRWVRLCTMPLGRSFIATISGLNLLLQRQEKGKDGKEFLALYFSGFCSHWTKVESIAAVNSFLKKKLGIGKSRGLETWQQLFPTNHFAPTVGNSSASSFFQWPHFWRTQPIQAVRSGSALSVLYLMPDRHQSSKLFLYH